MATVPPLYVAHCTSKPPSVQFWRTERLGLPGAPVAGVGVGVAVGTGVAVPTGVAVGTGAGSAWACCR